MGRNLAIVSLFFAAGAALQAQPTGMTCAASAVRPIIRAEGLTELLGDIVLTCSGPANREVSGALTIILNVPVTNRLTGTNLNDIVASVNNGAGITTLPARARLQLTNQVVFDVFRFTTGLNGVAEVRISNVRADVSQTSSGLYEITARLAFNPASILNFTTSDLSVGVVNRGMLATSLLGTVASQTGSPVPETMTFQGFLDAKTAYSSTRLTEGFNAAFEKRGPRMDTGIRLLIRYSGLPADARLFVPAALAGSSAQRPTAAGDFGGTPSAGQYVPGSGSLFLVRITSTDFNGNSGYPVGIPGPALLGEMTEVQMTSGSAVVVYEVYDSNPSGIESVQIPTFLGVARGGVARSAIITREVFFAPQSTVGNASEVAPIPRFAPIAPDSDCEITTDCNQYRPRLHIDSALLDFEAVQGLAYVRREVIFSNVAGGSMIWNARVEYKNGADWVQIYPPSGIGGAAVGTMLVLTNLTPGTYEATLVIDAGEAGVARIPIRLKLNPKPPPPPPVPAVTSVGNAATFSGALVPGSLATLKGSNLQGSAVTVTLDGKPARLIFNGADQINFQVPSDLTGATAQLVVAVNNVPGAASTVNIARANPGIFVPGILNQDFSVNSPTNPAKTGTFVQIYATGLLPPDSSGTVEAKLHDLMLTSLPFAGPAPGIPGVQQVNLQIPVGWPTMTTEVLLCTTAGGQRGCSPPVKISVQQAQ